MVNSSAKLSQIEEKCYVYIIGTSTGAYKVGIANDPVKRHRNLKSGIPDPSRLLLKIEVTNRAIALYVERELHSILNEYHTQGEWFRPPKNVLGELLLDLGEKVEALRPEAPLIQYQKPSATFGDCSHIRLEDDPTQDDLEDGTDAPEETPSDLKVLDKPFELVSDPPKICMNCRHWAPDPEQNYEKGLCSRMSLSLSRLLMSLGAFSGNQGCVFDGGDELDVFWRRTQDGMDLYSSACYEEIQNLEDNIK